MADTKEAETRRGLKVVRPKGKPFNYTEARNPYGDGTVHVRIKPNVAGDLWDDFVEVLAIGGEPAYVSCSAVLSGNNHNPDLTFVDQVAAALSWAVAYARRWNAKNIKPEDADAR